MTLSNYPAGPSRMDITAAATNDTHRAQGAGPSLMQNPQASNLVWLELPLDRPRRKREEFRPAWESSTLPSDLTIALRELSEAESVAPVAPLLAALEVMLARYTGQQETAIHVLFGDVEVTRGIDSESVQSVLVRSEVSPDLTFLQLLKTVNTVLTNNLRSAVPFELPNSKRELEPDEKRNFQVLFSAKSLLLPLNNFSHAVPSVAVQNIECDLHLSIEECTFGLLISLMYDSDLFESATIRRMLSHFQTLLNGLVARPELPVSALPILAESDRRQILLEWNNTAADYPHDCCVHQLVERQVGHTPTAIAVEYKGEILTYEELNARANQLARYLQRLGVGPEVPVGICLDRSFDLAITLLAVLKSGGVCVPLDPKYPPDRLTFMLEDARVLVLVTEQNLLLDRNGTTARTVCLMRDWRAIRHESCDNPTCQATPENLAYIIYTSGSTGKPRGVLLPHRGLVNHNTAAIRLYELRRCDRVLQFSSISFDISVEEIFPTWMAGATLVFRSEEMPLAASGFLHWIEKQKITVLDLPTAYWHELVHELAESKAPLPPALRTVIVGGEKASATAFASWLQASAGKVRWINTYGPTEASVIATAWEPAISDPRDAPSSLPIGRPIANTQVYVLDQHLNPIPVGIAGELYIGGLGVARGYLNRPEMTTARFIPDPFSNREGARLYRTGDLARYLASGEIEFLGRRDFQVKIRGYRVELGEIEAALRSHPDIREAVVVARSETFGDKRLTAYVVSERAAVSAIKQWRSFLKERLPEYMVPSSFVAVDALPLTPNGKVDRRTLENRELPQLSSHETVGPTDPIANELTRIWQSVLGIESTAPEDNFWDLGGHSLLAARLTQQVEQAFGTRLTLSALIEAPTLGQLAALIKQEDSAPSWSCLVALQIAGSKPPFFCVHGVGGNSVGFRDLARLVGEDQPFYGVQAQGLDGQVPCLKRVEEMAARYLQEICIVQPKGPYFLGGFSFGGWVAYEMALQLQARGQEVGLVALLDTYPFRLQPITSSLLSFLRVPTQQQLMHVLPKTVKKGIRRRIVWLQLPRGIKNVHRACYEAERHYQLGPYPGRVTLFRATESLTTSSDPHARWRDLATGGLEIQEVPGHHGDIIVEPQVRILAEKLRDSLERAQREQAESSWQTLSSKI